MMAVGPARIFRGPVRRGPHLAAGLEHRLPHCPIGLDHGGTAASHAARAPSLSLPYRSGPRRNRTLQRGPSMFLFTALTVATTGGASPIGGPRAVTNENVAEGAPAAAISLAPTPPGAQAHR